MRILSVMTLAVALSGVPLNAADGALDDDFSEDALDLWLESLDSIPPFSFATRVSDVTSSDGLLVSVGHVEGQEAGDTFPAWTAVDRFGVDADQDCGSGTAIATLYPAAVGGRLETAIVDSTGGLLVGGRIILLGSESQERAVVARFDLGAETCTSDDSFSDNGSAYFDDETWCDTEDCRVVGLAEIRPETGALGAVRTIALVESDSSGFSKRFHLLRLTTSGAVDTAFNGDGWREISAAGLGNLAPYAAMAIDGRGRIVVAVSRFDPEEPLDIDTYLLRFSASGSFDTSIGDAGLVEIADEGPGDDLDPLVADLAVDARGRAVVPQQLGDNARVTVVDPDTGVRATHVVFGADAAGVAVQGDDRYLFAYDLAASDGLRVTRRLIESDPLGTDVDPTFDGGTITYDVDQDQIGEEHTETAVALELWNGELAVGGTALMVGFPALSQTGSFALLAENDYIFVDGFEQGTPGLWSDAAGAVFP